MKGFMFRLNRLSALWRACLLILFVLAGRSASAQTITSGVIEGVAVDQNAAPLVEVLVQVTSPDGGPARSALTDRSGVFRIALLPADSTATIDPDFAKDVEAAIAAHREPLEPPAWD